MANKYYRLWNGTDLLEDDKSFQLKIVPYEQMKKDILDGRDFTIKHVAQIGKGSYLKQLCYKNEVYNIIFLNIKNSGLTNEAYRKRMQISNDINFKNDNPIYVIGAYNVGNKILYCSTNITDFVKGAIKGKTYSSFWIDYYHLKKAYEQDENVWTDNKDRIISCFTNDKLKMFDDVTLLRNLLVENEVSLGVASDFSLVTDEHGDFVDNSVVIFEEKVHSFNHKLLPRNQKLRDAAIQKANFTCELCGIQKTFETESDSQYFEGHHLIMYNINVQKRYRYCLDNIENIVCLCPTCHKKIHLSTDAEKQDCVLKLFVKHNKLISLFEINDIQPIINDYINGVHDE